MEKTKFKYRVILCVETVILSFLLCSYAVKQDIISATSQDEVKKIAITFDADVRIGPNVKSAS